MIIIILPNAVPRAAVCSFVACEKPLSLPSCSISLCSAALHTDNHNPHSRDLPEGSWGSIFNLWAPERGIAILGGCNSYMFK